MLDAIWSIDSGLAKFLNAFALKSQVFDASIFYLSNAKLFKFLPMVLAIWWLWFSGDQRARRVAALSAPSALLALLAARLIQNLMPMRPRPLHEPALALVPPFNVNPNFLFEWSSFPSDHLALGGALVTAIWLSSRKIGAAFLVWLLVAVAFPRVYLGLHYLSDIIAGLAIGVTVTLVVDGMKPMTRLNEWLVAASVRRPSLFYCAAFFISYEIAELFDEVRRLARFSHYAWGLL